MSTQTTENRQLPRLLCTEGFSDCLIHSEAGQFSLVSINYTREGIALFNREDLPEIDRFQLTFSYQMGKETVQISDLPCSLVHLKPDTGGCVYGAAFDLPACSDAQIDDLVRIEEHMAKNAKPA